MSIAVLFGFNMSNRDSLKFLCHPVVKYHKRVGFGPTDITSRVKNPVVTKHYLKVKLQHSHRKKYLNLSNLVSERETLQITTKYEGTCNMFSRYTNWLIVWCSWGTPSKVCIVL